MSVFIIATLEVYNLDHAVIMTVMKNGLQKCHFLFSLEKRVPTDFSKMLAKAKKYMCAEEVYEAHGPPSSPIIKEQPLFRESRSKKEDQGRGR